MHIYTYVYTYIYICIYVYIYVYIHIQREINEKNAVICMAGAQQKVPCQSVAH